MVTLNPGFIHYMQNMLETCKSFHFATFWKLMFSKNSYILMIVKKKCLSLLSQSHLQGRSNSEGLKLKPWTCVTMAKNSGMKMALRLLLNWNSFTPLLFFFSRHTFEIKSLKASNNPHQWLPLIAFARIAVFYERNGSGNSSSVIWWNPSFFQCMPPDWIAI